MQVNFYKGPERTKQQENDYHKSMRRLKNNKLVLNSPTFIDTKTFFNHYKNINMKSLFPKGPKCTFQSTEKIIIF